mgnify:CR=1 FL=1
MIRKTGRPLAALLVVALLAALFLGLPAGPGDAGAGPEPRTTTRTVSIPASAFAPMSDIIPYSQGPGYLETRSGSGTFMAAVYFEAPVVTIRKVVFYAMDAGSGNLIMGLYRTQVSAQETLNLGEVYTSGSAFTMQTITLSDLAERRISGAYGATLNIYLPGPYTDGYRFYGAKITYSY